VISSVQNAGCKSSC